MPTSTIAPTSTRSARWRTSCSPGQPVFAGSHGAANARGAHGRSAASGRRAAAGRAVVARRLGDALPGEGSGAASADAPARSFEFSKRCRAAVLLAMPSVLLGGPGMFRKALAIYAVAFVVVAIIAKAAIVGIGLPDWVFPGSLVVMALGLPVVLWTGYVQRVTRRAVTATPTYTPGGTPAARRRARWRRSRCKAAPHVSWYRTARGGMYAFGAFIALVAAFMALRALGIGPFGSLLASGRLESTRSDSAHRLPYDERRLDARARGERRGARRAVWIVGVHARAAGAKSSRRSSS